MDLVEAAHGIVEIANTAMVNALRLVSVQRGYDPRDFALVAFGWRGTSPRQPPRRPDRDSRGDHSPKPGHSFGLGTVGDGLKTRLRDTLIQRLDQVVPQALEQTFRELEEQGRKTLGREGMAEAAMDFRRQVDLRYVGQSHELTLPLTTGALDPAQLDQLLEQFHRTHDRRLRL